MGNKRKIISHVLIYGSATQITQTLAAVGGILTRNFLGPLQMGMWATVQIVLHYASYASLGTTQGIAREVPYYIGKKETQQAESIKNLVVSFQLMTAVGTAILIFLAALILRRHIPQPLFWGLIACGPLIVLERFNGLLISLLRAHKQFSLASKQMVVSAVVNLALIAVLTFLFKIYGFIVAMLLSYLFNIVYNFMNYDFQFKFELSRKIASVISFGFPLMVLAVLDETFKSVDKIMIVKMLGFEALGFYSVALMTVTFLGQLPSTLTVIMIPHFQEKYAERDRMEDVRAYVDKAASALSNFMPLVIGLSWLILPLFVSVLMPKYTEGIWAARLLILSSFFMAMTLPFGIVMVTLKKHYRIFPVVVFSLALSVLLNFIAIRMGLNISGVAGATTICLMINFLLMYFLAGSILYAADGMIRKAMSFLGKFFGLLLILFALTKVVVTNQLAFSVALQIAVFLVLSLPFLLSLNREFGLLEMIKEKLWLNR